MAKPTLLSLAQQYKASLLDQSLTKLQNNSQSLVDTLPKVEKNKITEETKGFNAGKSDVADSKDIKLSIQEHQNNNTGNNKETPSLTKYTQVEKLSPTNLNVADKLIDSSYKVKIIDSSYGDINSNRPYTKYYSQQPTTTTYGSALLV